MRSRDEGSSERGVRARLSQRLSGKKEKAKRVRRVSRGSSGGMGGNVNSPRVRNSPWRWARVRVNAAR